jgi:excisionase family DNA binding protein
MSSEYLTTEEAAAHLRVSVETIRRWCRQGKLATVRFGRAHRIPLRAMLALDPEHAQAEPQPQSTEAPAADEPPTSAQPDDADGEPLSPGWTRVDPMPDDRLARGEHGAGYGGRVVIIE